MEDFRQKLTENQAGSGGSGIELVGTINPISEMVPAAHHFGAKVFVDAVHYAAPEDGRQGLEHDFLACSAYKYFGPHLGIPGTPGTPGIARGL